MVPRFRGTRDVRARLRNWHIQFEQSQPTISDVTGQVNFNSHLDSVIAVAVSLVNTLTPGEARGRAYQPPAGDAVCAAVTTALRTGQRSARQVTSAEATLLAGTAARLRAVFDAVEAEEVDAAASLLNKMLAETEARPQLDRHDGEPWHLHFHSKNESLAQGWAAGCATGLAVVLGTDMYRRLGVCTAPRCDRVYVDVSRNGTRRFCSTACQYRV
jgi:predicted RNA-binding Zn ribbon-like protein